MPAPGVTRITARVAAAAVPDAAGVHERGKPEPRAEHWRRDPQLDVADRERIAAGGRDRDAIRVDAAFSIAARVHLTLGTT